MGVRRVQKAAAGAVSELCSQAGDMNKAYSWLPQSILRNARNYFHKLCLLLCFLWASLPEQSLRREQLLGWTTSLINGLGLKAQMVLFLPLFILNALKLCHHLGRSWCLPWWHDPNCHPYRVWGLSNNELCKLEFLHVSIHSYNAAKIYQSLSVDHLWSTHPLPTL